MELHHDGMFAAFKLFGYKDGDFDFMIANLLVRGAVHVETVQAGGRRGVVERSHVRFLLQGEY